MWTRLITILEEIGWSLIGVIAVFVVVALSAAGHFYAGVNFYISAGVLSVVLLFLARYYGEKRRTADRHPEDAELWDVVDDDNNPAEKRFETLKLIIERQRARRASGPA